MGVVGGCLWSWVSRLNSRKTDASASSSISSAWLREKGGSGLGRGNRRGKGGSGLGRGVTGKRVGQG